MRRCRLPAPADVVGSLRLAGTLRFPGIFCRLHRLQISSGLKPLHRSRTATSAMCPCTSASGVGRRTTLPPPRLLPSAWMAPQQWEDHRAANTDGRAGILRQDAPPHPATTSGAMVRPCVHARGFLACFEARRAIHDAQDF
jgi:hypothetical protein